MNQKLEIQNTADGSPTLFVPSLNESYHSHKGALSESQYVYIECGLQYFAQVNSSEKIRVFEVGFGTGLNAVLSWQFAASDQQKIEYETVEAFPILPEIWQKLHYFQSQQEKEIFQKLHEMDWGSDQAVDEFFTFKKFDSTLESIETSGAYDVIFFDAFAPSKQADIWRIENLEKIFHSMNPSGVLVTYCSQGQFKRNLKQLGFEVEVLPGALEKKEMVRAIKPS